MFAVLLFLFSMSLLRVCVFVCVFLLCACFLFFAFVCFFFVVIFILLCLRLWTRMIDYQVECLLCNSFEPWEICPPLDRLMQYTQLRFLEVSGVSGVCVTECVH